MEYKKITDESPAVIITSAQIGETGQPPIKRSYKKHVITAVGIVVAVAIILTAILVGMYLFTQNQKEIIKMSYDRNDGAKVDVASDANTNTVQYHVSHTAYELWVVDDFNREIQQLKIVTNLNTNCYLAPLNRTMAVDPSQIAANRDMASNTTFTLYYNAAKSPIPDTSFLGKAAKDMCKGISTYWLYPSCDNPAGKNRRVRRWCGSVKVGFGFWYIELSYCN